MTPRRAARRAGLGVVVLLGLALGVPALALTTLRLTEPSGARGVQAVSFTPFALLGYAGVLALLVGVAVARRSRSLPLLATAAAALAGLVLHAVWFAPLVVGERPSPAAGAERVVVMTANVLRGRADPAALVEEVREREVDVLVLTEITEPLLADLEQEGLAASLPHRAGLPGPADDVTGTMVLSTEPTRLLDVLDTTLGGLVVDTAGLRVMAVHPSSPVWPEHWHDDHRVVVAAVEEWEPDVLAGDFNATLDHRPLRELRDRGYRDAVELTNGGFAPTWPANGRFGVLGVLGPVAQIDHVLVADALTVTEADWFDLDGSDHRPVVATVAAR